MDDGEGVLVLFALVCIAIPLIIAGAIAVGCIKVAIYICRAIRDAIVNSPQWQAYELEQQRQVRLNALARTQEETLELIQAASWRTGQSFERKVAQLERAYPNEMRRKRT